MDDEKEHYLFILILDTEKLSVGNSSFSHFEEPA